MEIVLKRIKSIDILEVLFIVIAITLMTTLTIDTPVLFPKTHFSSIDELILSLYHIKNQTYDAWDEVSEEDINTYNQAMKDFDEGKNIVSFEELKKKYHV